MNDEKTHDDKPEEPEFLEADSEEIVEDTDPADIEFPDGSKKKSIQDRAKLLEEVKKNSSSQFEKVEQTMEQVDTIMEEYSRLKNLLNGVMKDHPELRKYL